MCQKINRTGRKAEKVEAWVWRNCRPVTFCLILLVAAAMNSFGMAQAEELQSEKSGPEATADSTMVFVDGHALFFVQGIPSIPAEERARLVAARIRELAVDNTFSPEKLTVTEAGDHATIMFGEKIVLHVHSIDAAAQGLERTLLAGIVKQKMIEAIRSYREERSPGNLVIKSARTAGAIALLVLLFFLIRRLSSRLAAWFERRYTLRVEESHLEALKAMPTERFLKAIHGLVYGIRTLVMLVLFVACSEYVLGLLPWTRPVANQMWELLLSPVSVALRAFLDAIPGLIFIGVVILILRYFLKLLKLLFSGIEDGSVNFSGFDPEWAWPTYKLVRLGLIAFGVVVAYPYIPGAETEAFKGISIFIGVIFSLGSSSVISNSISGYLLTYRRVFKVGDRVKIGDSVGDVVIVRGNVTHLRSLRNEVITIPNSTIVNSVVLNYSAVARKRGLLLPTTVGIGYETPWRQVEAMLLLAAKRTSGLREEPAPSVAQKGLGNFAVTYQLNVYTDRPEASARIKTELQRNILDIFNEYEIQIMSPTYEADPEQPKVVPKEKWYEAPAKPADKEPPMQEEHK